MTEDNDGAAELSDDELMQLIEQDEEAQQLLKLMAQRTCDYCDAPVRWCDPDDIAGKDPGSFDEVLAREGIDYGQIEMAWECTSCENFSLLGTDFETQWLDTPAQCPHCDSYNVNVLDPARVASIDRARYLEMKRKVGAQALLDSDAHQCLDCGVIEFYAPDVP